MKTETREIGNFDKIRFKDFGTLILTQGDQETLTIEADEDLIDELISDVRDGELVLGVDEDWLSRIGKLVNSIFSSGNHKVTYYLTFVSLKKISVSGQCNLTCDSIKADTLKINISGMGKLDFSHLECEDLRVNISGRGEVEALGTAKQQEVHISGSGDYQTPKLESQSTRIAISGQGNATLRAEKELDIAISGMGQVNYYGRPKLRQVISGLGKSKMLNEE
jgi:hypothetical protein